MITDEIKFNWVWSKYDPFGYETEEHRITPMKVVPIGDMVNYENEDWESGFKNRIQMSVARQRVVKDTPYDLWNGCIFIDIDYKNWMRDCPECATPPKQVLYKVFSYMGEHYTKNLYYGELSRSGKGFHFIYYYECEKTKEYFDYYTEYTREIIRHSFEECGYGEAIHYKGVLDDCTKSFCQCCYLTKREAINNYRCTGRLVVYDEIKVSPARLVDKIERTTHIQKDKWNYAVERVVDVDRVDYIDHYARWRLFGSLSRLYDGERLKREWERCARMIPVVERHNTQYYIDCPFTINDWNRCLRGDEYIDTDLLRRFGYEVRITPKETIIYEDLIKLLAEIN